MSFFFFGCYTGLPTSYYNSLILRHSTVYGWFYKLMLVFFFSKILNVERSVVFFVSKIKKGSDIYISMYANIWICSRFKIKFYSSLSLIYLFFNDVPLLLMYLLSLDANLFCYDDCLLHIRLSCILVSWYWISLLYPFARVIRLIVRTSDWQPQGH